MPLTLDALTILDAIDRRGSFARAAEELARAPSRLTYAVQPIEAGLDVLLFDRPGHRARFTPAGRVLLEEGRARLAATNALAHAQKPLSQADSAAHRAGVIADTGLEMVDAGAVAARCAGGGARCRLSPSR